MKLKFGKWTSSQGSNLKQNSRLFYSYLFCLLEKICLEKVSSSNVMSCPVTVTLVCVCVCWKNTQNVTSWCTFTPHHLKTNNKNSLLFLFLFFFLLFSTIQIHLAYSQFNHFFVAFSSTWINVMWAVWEHLVSRQDGQRTQSPDRVTRIAREHSKSRGKMPGK